MNVSRACEIISSKRGAKYFSHIIKTTNYYVFRECDEFGHEPRLVTLQAVNFNTGDIVDYFSVDSSGNYRYGEEVEVPFQYSSIKGIIINKVMEYKNCKRDYYPLLETAYELHNLYARENHKAFYTLLYYVAIINNTADPEINSIELHKMIARDRNKTDIIVKEAMKMKQLVDYSARALAFAERYGIVDYKVQGKTMVYYKQYPEYLNNPRYTIKHTVYLDSGREVTKQLKRNPKI